MRMLGRIGIVCVAALAFARGAAAAQEVPQAGDADTAAVAAIQRQLRADAPVVVVDREGRQYDGFVQRTSPMSIALAANGQIHEVPFRDIGRIDTRGDSLLNGAVLGVVASSPYWILATAFACDHRGAGCHAGTGVGTAGIFAALGAYLDSRHRGRTTIYGPPRGGVVEEFSSLWMAVEGGDRITVTGVDGTKTEGVFQRVANGSLTALVNGQIRTFASTDVLRVARRGDSLRNGTLIGVGFGVIPYLAPCDEASPAGCFSSGERLVFGAFSGLLFGALGALVDSLIVRHTDVYRARNGRVSMRLVPDLTAGHRGAIVSFSF